MSPKKFIKRLFPPIMIIIMTVFMSAFAYNDVLKMQEKTCWEILENTAQTINNEVKMRFKDNISILKLTANAMVQENRIESYNAITEHINAFQKMAIFNKINMIYPDNTVLLQSGERIKLKTENLFAQIAAKGEHISAWLIIVMEVLFWTTGMRSLEIYLK